MIKSLFLLGAGFMLALGFASCLAWGYKHGQRSVVAECYLHNEFRVDGTEFIRCYQGQEITIVEGSKRGKKR